MRERGFFHTTRALLALLAAVGLTLSIAGVSSDAPAPPTPEKTQATTNLPTLSTWHPQPPETKIGSFTHIARPVTERVAGDLFTLWEQRLRAATDRQRYETLARDTTRDKLLFNQEYSFQDHFTAEGERLLQALTRGSADHLTDTLVRATEGSARQLPFVRSIEWDYQTGLGERKWQSGLSALGALRETPDDAIVWQLRGYAAEETSAGANAGLIYRAAAAEDVLAGLNLFLDYEQHGGYEENFLRWSIGGELRTTHAEIHANRYFPITDPIADGAAYIYTRGGYDIDLAVHAPGARWLSGGFTYYKWNGEFGDQDDTGLRYNLRLGPVATLGNLKIEAEVDNPDSGGTDWGGRISYLHRFGAPAAAERAAPDRATFDARAHFFDPVRREYSQRITRSQGGAGPNIIVTSLENGGHTFIHTSAGTIRLAYRHDVGLFPDGRVLATSAIVNVANPITIRTDFRSGARAYVLTLAGLQITGFSSNTQLHIDARATVARLIEGQIDVDRTAAAPLTLIALPISETQIRLTTAAAARLRHTGGLDYFTLNSGRARLDTAIARRLTPALAGGTLHYRDPETNPAAPIDIIAHCHSAAARNAGRASGISMLCNGHPAVAHLSPGAAAAITTPDETINLTRTAAGNIIAQGHPAEWSADHPYPVPAPRGANIVLTGANPVLTLIHRAADGTATPLRLSGANAELRIRPAAPGQLNAILMNGRIETPDGAAAAHCDATGAGGSITAAGISIVPACGDITFTGAPQTRLTTPSGAPLTASYSVGGGNGQYNFFLQRQNPSDPDILRIDADSISGGNLNLVLDSPLTATVTYRLIAAPINLAPGVSVEPATLEITAALQPILQFTGDADGVYTVLLLHTDTDSKILTITYTGARGQVTRDLTAFDRPVGAVTATVSNVEIDDDDTGENRVVLQIGADPINVPGLFAAAVEITDTPASGPAAALTALIMLRVLDRPVPLVLPDWTHLTEGDSVRFATISVITKTPRGGYDIALEGASPGVSIDPADTHRLRVDNAQPTEIHATIAISGDPLFPGETIRAILSPIPVAVAPPQADGLQGAYLLGGNIGTGGSADPTDGGVVWQNPSATDPASFRDPANWRAIATVPALRRSGIAMLQHKDALLVIGGSDATPTAAGTQVYGDVWASTDGTTWTQRAANAFLPRAWHRAASIGSTLYLVGGRTDAGALFGDAAGESEALNDVWQSTDDGVTWTRLAQNAPFGSRWAHGLVVLRNGSLVVIGGVKNSQTGDQSQTGDGIHTDMWVSADGTAWTQFGNLQAEIPAARAAAVNYASDLAAGVAAPGQPYHTNYIGTRIYATHAQLERGGSGGVLGYYQYTDTVGEWQNPASAGGGGSAAARYFGVALHSGVGNQMLAGPGYRFSAAGQATVPDNSIAAFHLSAAAAGQGAASDLSSKFADRAGYGLVIANGALDAIPPYIIQPLGPDALTIASTTAIGSQIGVITAIGGAGTRAYRLAANNPAGYALEGDTIKLTAPRPAGTDLLNINISDSHPDSPDVTHQISVRVLAPFALTGETAAQIPYPAARGRIAGAITTPGATDPAEPPFTTDPVTIYTVADNITGGHHRRYTLHRLDTDPSSQLGTLIGDIPYDLADHLTFSPDTGALFVSRTFTGPAAGAAHIIVTDPDGIVAPLHLTISLSFLDIPKLSIRGDWREIAEGANLAIADLIASTGSGQMNFALAGASPSNSIELDATRRRLLVSNARAGDIVATVALTDPQVPGHTAIAAYTVAVRQRAAVTTIVSTPETIYLLGGATGTGGAEDGAIVWRNSSDLSNPSNFINHASWQPVATVQAFRRTGMAMLMHNGEILVIGGSNPTSNGGPVIYADVWASADGQRWTRRAAAAEFGARKWHRAISYKGEVYVIGGHESHTDIFPTPAANPVPKNDVWKSADGANWTQVTENAPFPPRWAHGLVEHQGNMVVIGGIRPGATGGAHKPAGSANENLHYDMWASGNGENWTQAGTLQLGPSSISLTVTAEGPGLVFSYDSPYRYDMAAPGQPYHSDAAGNIIYAISPRHIDGIITVIAGETRSFTATILSELGHYTFSHGAVPGVAAVPPGPGAPGWQHHYIESEARIRSRYYGAAIHSSDGRGGGRMLAGPGYRFSTEGQPQGFENTFAAYGLNANLIDSQAADSSAIIANRIGYGMVASYRHETTEIPYIPPYQIIPQAPAALLIAANQPAGAIAEITATGGGALYRYLTAPGTPAAFSIVIAAPAVPADPSAPPPFAVARQNKASLAITAPLTPGAHPVTVIVSDERDDTADATVIITIRAVAAPAAAAIAAVGITVPLTLYNAAQATDSGGATLTYTLLPQPTGITDPFAFDPANGELRLAIPTALDQNIGEDRPVSPFTAAQTITAKILIRDAAGALGGITATITLNVLDRPQLTIIGDWESIAAGASIRIATITAITPSPDYRLQLAGASPGIRLDNRALNVQNAQPRLVPVTISVISGYLTNALGAVTATTYTATTTLAAAPIVATVILTDPLLPGLTVTALYAVPVNTDAGYIPPYALIPQGPTAATVVTPHSGPVALIGASGGGGVRQNFAIAPGAPSGYAIERVDNRNAALTYTGPARTNQADAIAIRITDARADIPAAAHTITVRHIAPLALRPGPAARAINLAANPPAGEIYRAADHFTGGGRHVYSLVSAPDSIYPHRINFQPATDPVCISLTTVGSGEVCQSGYTSDPTGALIIADLPVNATSTVRHTDPLTTAYTATIIIAAHEASGVTPPVTATILLRVFTAPQITIIGDWETLRQGDNIRIATVSIATPGQHSGNYAITEPGSGARLVTDNDQIIIRADNAPAGLLQIALELTDPRLPGETATATYSVPVHPRQINGGITSDGVYLLGGGIGTGGADDPTDGGVVWQNTRASDPEAFRDPANWQPIGDPVPAFRRTGIAMIEHNGELIVIGGSNAGPRTAGDQTHADVWASSNGIDWTQRAANAAFGPRAWHRVISHNGALYLIGGRTDPGALFAAPETTRTSVIIAADLRPGAAPGAVVTMTVEIIVPPTPAAPAQALSDVWRSQDNGATWTRLAENAFPARWAHGAVIHNNQLAVIGGIKHGATGAQSQSSDNVHHDIWLSQDGITWEQAPDPADTPRVYEYIEVDVQVEYEDRGITITTTATRTCAAAENCGANSGGGDGTVTITILQTVVASRLVATNTIRTTTTVTVTTEARADFPRPDGMFAPGQPYHANVLQNAIHAIQPQNDTQAFSAVHGYYRYHSGAWQNPRSGDATTSHNAAPRYFGAAIHTGGGGGHILAGPGYRFNALGNPIDYENNLAVYELAGDHPGGGHQTELGAGKFADRIGYGMAARFTQIPYIPPYTITPRAPARVTVSSQGGAAAGDLITAQGGNGQYQYTIAGDTLGYTLAPAIAPSGSPAAALLLTAPRSAGEDTITIQIRDSHPDTVPVQHILTVRVVEPLAAAPAAAPAEASALTGRSGYTIFDLAAHISGGHDIRYPANPTRIDPPGYASRFNITDAGILTLEETIPDPATYTLRIRVSEASNAVPPLSVTVLVAVRPEAEALTIIGDWPNIGEGANLNIASVAVRTPGALNGEYRLRLDEDHTSDSVSLNENDILSVADAEDGILTARIILEDQILAGLLLTADYTLTVAPLTTTFTPAVYFLGGRQDSDGGIVWRNSAQPLNGGNFRNGGNWQAVATVAAFARNGLAMLEHSGELLVIAGADADGAYADVWASGEGIHWTQRAAAAEFGPRAWHRAVSHEGAVYLIGGRPDTSGLFTTPAAAAYNDVWKSADGARWTQLTADAPFPGRWAHGLVRHQGSIVVLGGVKAGFHGSIPASSEGALDDMWASSDGQNWVYLNTLWAPDASDHLDNDPFYIENYHKQGVRAPGQTYFTNPGDTIIYAGKPHHRFPTGVRDNLYMYINGKWESAYEAYPVALGDGYARFYGVAILSHDGTRALAGPGQIFEVDGRRMRDENTFAEFYLSPDRQAGRGEQTALPMAGSRTGYGMVNFQQPDLIYAPPYIITPQAPAAATLYQPGALIAQITATGGGPNLTYALAQGTPAGYTLIPNPAGGANLIYAAATLPSGQTRQITVIISDGRPDTADATHIIAVATQPLQAPTVTAAAVTDTSGYPLYNLAAHTIVPGLTHTPVIVSVTPAVAENLAIDQTGNLIIQTPIADPGAATARIALQETQGRYTLTAAVIINIRATPRFRIQGNWPQIRAADTVTIARVIVSPLSDNHTIAFAAESDDSLTYHPNGPSGREIRTSGAEPGVLHLTLNYTDALIHGLTLQAAYTLTVRPTLTTSERIYLIGGNPYPFGGNQDGAIVLMNQSAGAAHTAEQFRAVENWQAIATVNAFRRSGLAMLHHNGEIFVIGGNNAARNSDGTTVYSDVWVSAADDGARWTQRAAAAQFGPRFFHRVVSYEGDMYLVGGRSDDNHIGRGETAKNDVWKSADGANWTLLTASPGFDARWAHGLVVYQGSLVVIAGVKSGKDGFARPNSGDVHNDMWASTDGVTWSEINVPNGVSDPQGRASCGGNFNAPFCAGPRTPGQNYFTNAAQTTIYALRWGTINQGGYHEYSYRASGSETGSQWRTVQRSGGIRSAFYGVGIHSGANLLLGPGLRFAFAGGYDGYGNHLATYDLTDSGRARSTDIGDKFRNRLGYGMTAAPGPAVEYTPPYDPNYEE